MIDHGDGERSAESNIDHLVDEVPVIVVVQWWHVIILVRMLWGVEISCAHKRINNAARDARHRWVVGRNEWRLD